MCVLALPLVVGKTAHATLPPTPASSCPLPLPTPNGPTWRGKAAEQHGLAVQPAPPRQCPWPYAHDVHAALLAGQPIEGRKHCRSRREALGDNGQGPRGNQATTTWAHQPGSMRQWIGWHWIGGCVVVGCQAGTGCSGLGADGGWVLTSAHVLPVLHQQHVGALHHYDLHREWEGHHV